MVAGDEQDFDTPGSALDGWSREAPFQRRSRACLLVGGRGVKGVGRGRRRIRGGGGGG